MENLPDDVVMCIYYFILPKNFPKKYVLQFSQINKTNFQYTQICMVQLKYSSLNKANFKYTKLSDVNLNYSTLNNVNIYKANLKKSISL